MEINEYKDVFLAESREYLQALNDSLLKLESEPENIAIVQEMFRSAHSLKGMSATMRFDRLTKLTHEMENILHLLREESISLSSELADTLFHSLDSLESLIARVEDPQLPDIDIDPLIERLGRQAYAEATTKLPEDNCDLADLDEFMKEIVRESLERGESIYSVSVTIQDDALLKSVRAYMAVKALEEKGVMLYSNPSVSDLETDNFGQSFTVLLQCEAGEQEIKACVEDISEIERVLVRPFTLNLLGEQQQDQETGVRPQDNSAAAAEGQEEKNSVSPAASAGSKEKTVRVDIGKLDKLINMVGELVINRTQLVELGRESQGEGLVGVTEQLDRITSELQGAVMKLRMIPIKQVFDRFPRMVRDLSRDRGKTIHLEIIGEDTELDRSIVNQIGDPLVHLLRNAVDHGVEPPEERISAGKNPEGIIHLEARYEGSNIAIEVRDDGRGLDGEKLLSTAVKKGIISKEEAGRLQGEEIYRLIFKNGFSTAAQVTDVSGRGVGMDAVRKMIEDINGQIEIQSALGEGTCITLRLPLTLAIIKALLVKVCGETYAIPIESIRENLLITAKEIKTVNKKKVISLREDIIPLESLEKCLVDRERRDWSGDIPVVIVRTGDKKIGLIVDELLGQQEVVIKSFGSLLGQLKGVAGATVLGNGKVALILNVATLI